VLAKPTTELRHMVEGEPNRHAPKALMSLKQVRREAYIKG
jgi:hypothetical protein